MKMIANQRDESSTSKTTNSFQQTQQKSKEEEERKVLDLQQQLAIKNKENLDLVQKLQQTQQKSKKKVEKAVKIAENPNMAKKNQSQQDISLELQGKLRAAEAQANDIQQRKDMYRYFEKLQFQQAVAACKEETTDHEITLMKKLCNTMDHG